MAHFFLLPIQQTVGLGKAPPFIAFAGIGFDNSQSGEKIPLIAKANNLQGPSAVSAAEVLGYGLQVTGYRVTGLQVTGYRCVVVVLVGGISKPNRRMGLAIYDFARSFIRPREIACCIIGGRFHRR